MRLVLTTAVLLTLTSAASVRHEQGEPTASPEGGGLILAKDEGDHRVRRPRPQATGAAAAASLIIKVDQANGGSSNFFMGFEQLEPGAAIPTHRHRMYDEILFIHRGMGVATLGSLVSTVREGATIYIPADTRVGLRNIGNIPLELVFVFPRPEVVSAYYNELTVRAGQSANPFTSEEFAAFKSRHRGHIEFE